jgi:hypothetical protein
VSSFSACDQSLAALPGPPLRACEISYARERMWHWHLVQPHLPLPFTHDSGLLLAGITAGETDAVGKGAD